MQFVGGRIEGGVFVLGDQQGGGEQRNVGIVGIAQILPGILPLAASPAAAEPRCHDLTQSVRWRKTPGSSARELPVACHERWHRRLL